MKPKEHPNRLLQRFIDENGVVCAELRLGHYRSFFIDATDVSLVQTRSWSIDYSAHRKDKVYVHSNKPYERLHRFLLGVKDASQYIDHVNGDPLDNRRSNIRIATAKQNAANQIRRIKSGTGYRGVYKVYQRYHARIKIDGVKLHLGTFSTAEEAAMAWNWKALSTWGVYARLNAVLSLSQLASCIMQT